MKRVVFASLILFWAWIVYGQQPKLVLPIGHGSAIYYSVFSPDGKRIVSVSYDKTAKIWDAQSGALLTTLNGHSEFVDFASFSNDGKKVVTASWDNTAKIWDVKSGSLIMTLKGHTDYVATAIFSHDGKTVLTASWDKTAKIWDAQSGTLIKTITGHRTYLVSAVFSPDGNKVYTATYDSAKIWIWDLKSGTLIKTIIGPTMSVNFASFSSDGNKAITASWNDSVEILDLQSGKLITTLKGHTDRIVSAVFSQDGKRVVTASWDKTAKIWDLQSGKLLTTLEGHKDMISSAVFSSDGKKVITSSSDKTAKVWDAQSGQGLITLTGHTGLNYSANFSPNGKEVAMAVDNKIIIWDLQTGKLLKAINGHNDYVKSVVFSPDGRRIVSTSWDSTAKIWENQTGTLIATLRGHNNNVVFAAFSPDGKKIVTASWDQTAKIWDAQTGTLITTLMGHSGYVSSAIFSPDGKAVVTASFDNTANIWDAKSGLLIKTLDRHTSYVYFACYSPDGENIVTASLDRTAKIWDAKTGTLIKSLSGHKDGVFSAVFSPDGKTVATASMDNTSKIWDVQSGSLITTLVGHTNYVYSADFNRDGKKLITASFDYSSKIWDTQSGKELFKCFILDSSDYFLQLPNNYYQCTPNAAKLLHYVTPDLKVITFEQLDVKYNRPDKVLEAIGNTDTNMINSYRLAYFKRIKKLGIDTTSFTDGYSVPEADFVNRDSIDYEQSNETLKLHIAGKDDSFLLDRFNVFVNGSPFYGLRGINIRPQNKHNIDTTISITLSQGKNSIETSILNVNGIESYRMPLQVNYTPAQPVAEKIYFIGIGANHFADSQYNLQFSSKDIRDLAAKMKNRYGDSIVIDTFLDEQVIPSKIMALKQKLLKTTVNDKVIIAYSGHGLLSKDFDYYLSTYNINFKKPEENGLPYDALESLLDSIPARKKLLLIDACNSGEVDKDEMARMTRLDSSAIAHKGAEIFVEDSARLGTQNTFELMQNLFVNVGRNTGATVIAAAAGTQYALEKADLKNGVFTYSILENMKSHDHANVNELKQYVNNRVSELTNGIQVPTARQENLEFDWQVW